MCVCACVCVHNIIIILQPRKIRLKKTNVKGMNDHLAKENSQLKAALNEAEEKLKRTTLLFDSRLKDVMNVSYTDITNLSAQCMVPYMHGIVTV